jgi:ferritin
MMISERMAARLNEQVNHEFFNMWAYYSMAYWFENAGLTVFAKFFQKQAKEEQGHGEKIAKYLIDQGAHVKLAALPAPAVEFKSAKEVVEAFVQHEIKTTKMVHEIVDLAIKENDHATRNFIDWKVDEQVEEVASANEMAQMVRYAETPGQLMMLEGRVYHMLES